MTRLQVLRVGRNRLVALPPEIGQLDRLKELQAPFNRITKLSNGIFHKLQAIEAMDLQDNKLTHLPDSIGIPSHGTNWRVTYFL